MTLRASDLADHMESTRDSAGRYVPIFATSAIEAIVSQTAPAGWAWSVETYEGLGYVGWSLVQTDGSLLTVEVGAGPETFRNCTNAEIWNP